MEIVNNTSNSEVVRYLESVGPQQFSYEVKSNLKSGYIQEKGGVTHLWYKNANGAWLVKLFEINRLLE